MLMFRSKSWLSSFIYSIAEKLITKHCADYHGRVQRYRLTTGTREGGETVTVVEDESRYIAPKRSADYHLYWQAPTTFCHGHLTYAITGATEWMHMSDLLSLLVVQSGVVIKVTPAQAAVVEILKC